MKKLPKESSVAFPARRKLGASLVSLWMVVVFGLPLYALHLKDATEGRELAVIPVQQADRFEVEYLHSVYRVKQSEIFAVGGDARFYLEKVTFGSYAAADYYDPDPPQGFAFQDSHWIVKGNGKNYSALKYRVSPGSGHVLRLKNLTLDLSGDSKTAGRLIEIFLERLKGN